MVADLLAARHWRFPAQARQRLTLDEQPHAVAIAGCDAETLPTRPLCAPGQWFDSYTSTIRHLDRRSGDRCGRGGPPHLALHLFALRFA
jgi:hypothetical protein